MSSLAELLVERQVTSRKDLERALARQMLYGEDLSTNLAEVTRLDERLLATVMAEHFGIAAAPAGELPRSDPPTLGRLPRDVALRFGIYPLASDDRGLGSPIELAVSQPIGQPLMNELVALLHSPIEPRYATNVRIRQAVARDYGLPLDRRTTRVIAKLEGKPDPMPSVSPSPLHDVPSFSTMPRPPSIPPIGMPFAEPAPPRPREAGPLPTAISPASTSEKGELPFHASPESGLPRRTATNQSFPPVPVRRADTKQSFPPPVVKRTDTNQGFPLVGPRRRDTNHSFPPPSPAAPPPDPEGEVRDGIAEQAPPSSAAQAIHPSTLARDFTTSDDHPRTTRPAPVPPLEKLVPRTPVVASSNQIGAALRMGARDRGTKRHRGPYTAELVEQDLRSAKATSEVLAAFFDFAAQYFEYSALFAVHGDIAEGRDASGPGLDRKGIVQIGVPLDIPSLMSKARGERKFVLERLGEGGLDLSFAKDLGRAPGGRVLVLPVSIRNRCVLLFYGDEGGNNVSLADVGEVLAMAPLVAGALERILVQRKRSLRASAQGADPVPPRSRAKPRFAPPKAEDRARALAQALDLGGSSGTAEPPGVEAAYTSPPGEPAAAPMHPGRPFTEIPIYVDGPGASVPAGPISRTNPEPERGGVAAGESLRHQLLPSVGPMSAAGTARDPQMTFGVPHRPSPALATTLDQRLARTSDIIEDDWEIPEDPMPQNASIRPLARGASGHPAAEHEPRARSSGTAAHIKRERQQTDELVARLLQGDHQAGDKLVELGVGAIASVIRVFPGPIRQEISKDRKASTCGPILGVLARMGEQAAPFVVVRTGDSDPNVRRWATLLLAEMPNVWSVQAICKRLLDEQSEVRRAALRAAHDIAASSRVRRDNGPQAALAEAIGSSLFSPTLAEDDRLVLVQALAELRVTPAVPLLIELLESSTSVKQSAAWALRVITGHNFGYDKPGWTAWWQANLGRHRIEWLLEALLHPDPEIRGAAGDELRDLSGQEFGFRENATPDRLQEIQLRYRAWWEATAGESVRSSVKL